MSALFDSAPRRAELDRFARDYRDFVGAAKFERLVVRRLAVRADGAAIADLPEKLGPAGTLYAIALRGKALALVRIGRRPATDGVNIMVAPIDGPALGVKQNAVYGKLGFSVFDTWFRGPLADHRWLSVPLALYGFVARDEGKGADIRVGDGPRDPVFVVPDLLPHLSAKAQADRIIDPERTDAVAGHGRVGGVLARLAKHHGFRADDYLHAELFFVPAGSARFIGVDRAFIAGYAHSARVAAFAFARAITDESPARTTVVALLGGGNGDTHGNVGLAFVRSVVGRLLTAAAKADRGDEPDEPALRATLARSLVVVAESSGGALSQGPVLNQVQDDGFPEAYRKILRAFDHARVPFQVGHKWAKWPVVARDITAWNLDAISLSVPVSDFGAPVEVVSSADVFGLYTAARAILRHVE